MFNWLRKPPQLTETERNKAASEERMRLFDTLPTKWREYANEHGLNKTYQAMSDYGE